MTIKKRITRLEDDLGQEAAVPMLVQDLDGKYYCGGDFDEHGRWRQRETTREAWLAEYGEQIERERRRYPNRIFVISFAGEHDEAEATEVGDQSDLA